MVKDIREELKLYTVQETAEITRASKLTIYNSIKSGKLHAIKRGGKWLITDKDIKEYLGLNVQ